MTRARDDRSFVEDGEADAAVTEIYALLGEMMVSWNQCEGRLRRLVVRLAGGKQPRDIALTAFTSVEDLLQLLDVLVEFADEDVKDHLVHYRACVERLREHHNFLARGVHYVGETEALPGARAWVAYLAGKRELRPRQDRLDAESLRALIADLTAVSAYGRALLAKLSPGDETTWVARRWPRKPPLPDRLGKPAPLLLGEPPPPAAAKPMSTAQHSTPPPLRSRPT